MRTAIVTYARVLNDGGTPTFRAAGNRLRLVPAYQALADAGTTPVIFAGAEEADILASRQFRNVDQVVFGKLLKPMRALREHCRASGIRIVFDICDDPWDYPELRPVIDAAGDADFCTTSSEGLARKLRSRLGVRAEIVKEPPDCAYAEPRVGPFGDRVRFLWFGSDTNADSLDGLVETLRPLTAKHKIALKLIGGERRRYEPVLASASADFSVSFERWELGLIDREMNRADIVLIPKRAGRWSELKSENRLVSALAAGRIAVAGPIESYLGLSDWCVLTTDFLSAVKDILNRPAHYLERVRAGQDHVRRYHDRAVIQRRWLEILT